MCRAESVNDLTFFFQFTSSHTIKYWFFNKSIKVIKHHVILTCNNYYATDRHFITVLWVRKEKKKDLKDKNSLKLYSWTTFWSWNYIFETFLNNNIYIETMAKAMEIITIKKHRAVFRTQWTIYDLVFYENS